jgi:hypothetical protein
MVRSLSSGAKLDIIPVYGGEQPKIQLNIRSSWGGCQIESIDYAKVASLYAVPAERLEQFQASASFP